MLLAVLVAGCGGPAAPRLVGMAASGASQEEGTSARGSPRCNPTGWVDRIEGDFAVVVTDSDEEEVLPTRCFPEPVRPGTRVVLGRVDWDETRKMRQEIDGLLRKLQERSN